MSDCKTISAIFFMGLLCLSAHAQQRPGGLLLPDANRKNYMAAHWKAITGVTLNSLALERSEGRASLPSAVDNSKEKYFPKIADQGRLSSCVPFSVNYYQFTSNMALALGWDVKSSGVEREFSPKWTYNMINAGKDEGSYWTDAYEILEKHGAVFESDFPYDDDYLSWDLKTLNWMQALSYRAETVQQIPDVTTSTGFLQMKQLLANGYVLVFGTYIDSWRYMKVANDPHRAESVAYKMDSSNQNSHSMTIVGYNDEIWTDINGNGVIDPGELGALKIANSWGTTYGNAGYIWLAYDGLYAESQVPGNGDKDRTPAFTTVYHLPVRMNYSPKLLARFTVSADKRDQLGIVLGSAPSPAQEPSTIWYPGALQNQGGPQPLKQSTFVFDATDLLPHGSEKVQYFVEVSDKSADGAKTTVSEMVLIDVHTQREIPTSKPLPAIFDGTFDDFGFAYLHTSW